MSALSAVTAGLEGLASLPVWQEVLAPAQARWQPLSATPQTLPSSRPEAPLIVP